MSESAAAGQGIESLLHQLFLGWQDSYDVLLNGTKLELTTNLFHKSLPHGLSEVSPRDVHTADGVVRKIITINGQFPGPAIEVLIIR